MDEWREQAAELDVVSAKPLREQPLTARLRPVEAGASLPLSAVRYIAAMSALAAVFSLGWPLLAGRGDVHASDFALATALVAVAHLFRLRMTRAGAPINFSLGEAALIIACTVLPVQWVPLAMGLGVLVARLIMHSVAATSSAVESTRTVASLTVAAWVGSFAVSVTGVDPRPLDPGDSAVLAAGALLYLVFTAVLLGLYLSARDGHFAIQVAWTALRGSTVMIVGNLVVGVLGAVLWQQRSPWLWVLPALLWLLHQLYTHRLREDEDYRSWREFAVASRSLHQLDQNAVAMEGIRAALALFDVRSAELTVTGSRQRYRGTSGGEVTAVDAGSSEHQIAPPGLVVRTLEVADSVVGQLALLPAQPGSWGYVHHHRLAAFGDALAAALHDASTHTALAELRDMAAFQSLHDPLTRLLNRDALLDRGDAILRACDPRRAVALLLLDLDNFKEVNDTLGHLAGDELLQIVSTRVAQDVGQQELVARLGGDEFGLLLTELPEEVGPGDPGCPSAAASVIALRRARVLAALLATPMQVAGVTLSAEVSVGVVTASAGSVDMTELLRRADVALYRAKESGSRVCAYEAEVDQASTDRLALVAELRTALTSEDQLRLLLQPIVELATGAPCGVEALVRWHHPRRGELTPAHFLHAVESSDLLGEFTRRVLDMALRLAAEWADHGVSLPVAVNLSSPSLRDPKLPGDVADLLRRHGVPAQRLVLEITETVVLGSLPVTDQVLDELRALGVRLSADDFGTGCSSLTFLTRIPVDELKVDRTFVGKMIESKQAAAIVGAVIDLARRLGLRVVAEGVETAEQRAVLTALGCDAAAGFLFSRPVDADQIMAALRGLREGGRSLRSVRDEAG